MPLRVPPKVLKDPKTLENYVHKHIFPEISLEHRKYLARFFTELFNSGFETEDNTFTVEWSGKGETGGAITVSGVNPKQGTYHARANVTGTGIRQAYCYKSGFDESMIYLRQYVYFMDELPDTSSDELIAAIIRNVADNAGLCQMGARGTTAYWGGNYRKAGAWTGWTNLSYTASLNTWYCMEMSFYVYATEGWFKAWLNDELIFSDVDIDTSQNGNAGEIRCGIYRSYMAGDPSHNVDLDCVVVADAYIGPEEEVTLKTVTDSFSLSESVLRNKTLILSDSLGLADALYGNKSLLLSDSASLSELVTVIIGEVMKYVTDSVSSNDLASTPFRVLRAFEAVGAADDVVVNKVLQITETVSLAEIIDVGVGGVKKTKLFLILGDLAVQLTGD